MTFRIEKILNTAALSTPSQEEQYEDPIGGWSSRIRFLHGENVFPLLGTKEAGLSPSKQYQVEVLNAGRKLSSKVQKDVAQGIRNGFISRPDLRTEVHFPAFSQSPYVTTYRMLHNGHIPGAITSSLDRISPKLSMARQMTTTDSNGAERSIAYAARPDSWEKAVDLAELVFQGELRCGKTIPQKGGVYQLKFVVNSSLSLIPGSAEYKMALREYRLLKLLHGQIIKLRRPDGTVCPVKCQVLFFAKQMNFCSSLEKHLSGKLSGKKNSELLTATPDEIAAFIGHEEASQPQIKELLDVLKWHKNLSAEEDILCRTLLFKRAGIPLVFHCKSCIDRTSIAIAIAYALDQWEQSGRPIPQIPYTLIYNETFKELFCAQLSTAHWMTFYSRGDRTEKESFGFKWHQERNQEPIYFTQNPGMLALIPERFKKVEFTPIKYMALTPGGTVTGMRNIAHNFRTWITAKDQSDRRVWVAFCRALFLIPLLLKSIVDTFFLTLCDPTLGVLKTAYHFHPEKVVPNTTKLNGRPLIETKAAI